MSKKYYLEFANSYYFFPACAGESLKDLETNGNTSVRKEKSGGEPIIIPIVLKMAEFDHKVWGCFYARLWVSLYYNVTSARFIFYLFIFLIYLFIFK